MRPDATPDRPLPFGYETAWFAARAPDPDCVLGALGVRGAVPASWFAGLPAAVEREGIFVTPPVDGWVFAVGSDAFLRGDVGRIAGALCRLGAACGPAYWFATHARSDVHGWAQAQRGQLVRAYLYDGEDVRVAWDEGPATPAEVELGFFVDDPRDTSDDLVKWWPTPADVVRLAGVWSRCPIGVAGRGTPGVGRLGRL